MTLDQVIFVAVNIHDWTKSSHEVTCRALEIINSCEQVISAQEKVKSMEERGLSPIEMLKEVLSGRPDLSNLDLSGDPSKVMSSLRELIKSRLNSAE